MCGFGPRWCQNPTLLVLNWQAAFEKPCFEPISS
jgi:hypothetical protein